MKLSIIVPVFNEEKTVSEVLEKLSKLTIKGMEKEIIVVNDGSTDNSKLEIQSFSKAQGKNSKLKGIKVISHNNNLGKGAAVRTGIKHAKGDYIVIQDSDLEYNPKDIAKLLLPIIKNKAIIVYGTRLKRLPNLSGEERTKRFFIHYLGNKFLSLVTSILYGQWITDMETGYKVFSKNAVDRLSLKSRSFDFEPELTVKLLKKGYSILEIPITTNPRNYKEGKKLNTIKDGFVALWTLLKYRVVD